MEDAVKSGEEAKTTETRLTIIHTSDGKLSVEAPGVEGMFDEMLCFWLLEKGKDFIKIRNAQIMSERRKGNGLGSLFIPNRQGRRNG